MPVIIGPFTVKNQTGGKFNFGVIFLQLIKTTDQPSVSVNGIITDIIYGDAVKTVKEFAVF